jgi:hypothetical protein
MAMSDRLCVSADYFHRFGLWGDFNEPYGEGRILYGLTSSGNIALTAACRRARKPRALIAPTVC